MTCTACRGLGVNVDALPDVIDPKLTLRDAVGLFGGCQMCETPDASTPGVLTSESRKSL